MPLLRLASSIHTSTLYTSKSTQPLVDPACSLPRWPSWHRQSAFSRDGALNAGLMTDLSRRHGQKGYPPPIPSKPAALANASVRCVEPNRGPIWGWAFISHRDSAAPAATRGPGLHSLGWLQSCGFARHDMILTVASNNMPFCSQGEHLCVPRVEHFQFKIHFHTCYVL